MDSNKRRFLRSLFGLTALSPFVAPAQIVLESADELYPEPQARTYIPPQLSSLEPSDSDAIFTPAPQVQVQITPPYSQEQYVQPYKSQMRITGNLSEQISTTIKAMRNQGRISGNEITAWQVCDINSGRVLAAINHTLPLQAASMIKPFVIQAYLFQNRRRPAEFPLTEQIINTMRLMIVRSSNSATNTLFARLGGAYAVQTILRREASDIFRNTTIVENIPAGGRTYRNRASCGDYTRFMQALWREKLPNARLLKDLMGIKNPDRIASKTQHVPEHLKIYDKTGSTSQLCGDFGIVDYRDHRGRSRPYGFVGIVQKHQPCSNYGSWIRQRGDVIREISDLVYLYIDQIHNS